MPGVPRTRHGPTMKILIRVLLIGVLLIGGFLFRDRLTGNAGDLTVGDCFDVPAVDTNISDVQHHPCTDAHTGEVVFVGKHPAATGVVFAEPLLLDFAGASCIPALETYVGTALPESLDIGAFYPLAKDWDTGDREITCYLYQIDGSTMTTSLKAS